MFPIRDSIPRVHIPWAVWCIIAANVLLSIYEWGLSEHSLARFIHLYGVVPARYVHPDWARFVGFPEQNILPLFSHMFLHGGLMHLLVNMWTMWIFADNIEDVMGPVRFTVFYLLCGLAALATHTFFNMNSSVPIVGASGAVAGVMGAYFLLYPHAKVFTFIPIFIIPFFYNLPAVIYLGIWFGTQVISGFYTSGDAAGVAWWAHVGGFVAGMLLLPLFRNSKRCYYCYGRPKKRVAAFFESR